jgi:hypothetical protein
MAGSSQGTEIIYSKVEKNKKKKTSHLANLIENTEIWKL